MKEYKTISVETDQNWGGAKGSVNTAALDETLNLMAREGWELVCVEDLKHTAGSGTLLCIFSRDMQS
ncbi:DUF4177 domain-containing protein [Stratiformator vulcanicus]|uniref:DUF4177 domain-containing protein n=1 Tax=Stratiformator vulcanicus TaxID=2527980 RepID=A0A517R4R2_9PLAN|nr:DUF4177 domain-containing protein [Stratiformator vulcanicus]QDT38840.1 hypothetical protein Pan189_32390 [Stratiformator vulcanicus]